MVAWLRSQGADLLYAAESRVQTPDHDLLDEAEAQGYVILTEDKDFGELVYRGQRNSHGIILMRMEGIPAADRLSRLRSVWTVLETNLPGNFVVVSRQKVRVRPLKKG